jgi:flagellar biogenesis protein FliO
MFQTLAVLALVGAVESAGEGAAVAPATREGSAAQAAQPAPPSAADAMVAAAFGKVIDTPNPDLKVPAVATSAMEWTNLAAPALGLVGLAALAFAVTRRRRGPAASIAIVESAALGPRRSLVIADVLGDRLVLAVSEAGVTVLSSRAAPAPATSAAQDAFIMARLAPAKGPGLLRRLFGRAPTPRFSDALAESVEDEELRAKLAAGFRGTTS